MDDDNYFRESLIEILQYYGYYNILSFATSQDFLNRLDKNSNIDLLILDFILEDGKNGEDILKYLKDKGYDIPVFVISGYIDSTILKLKKYLSVKNILEKPFTGSEFISQINNYFFSQE